MTSIGAPRARNIDPSLMMFAGSSYNDINSYNCSAILELIALACSCRSFLQSTIQFKASVFWLKWSGVLGFTWTSSVSPVPVHSDSKFETKSIRYRAHQLFSLPVVFPFASDNKSFNCTVKCAKEEKKEKKRERRYWRVSKNQRNRILPFFLGGWNENCSLTLRKLPNLVLKKIYCKIPQNFSFYWYGL